MNHQKLTCTDPTCSEVSCNTVGHHKDGNKDRMEETFENPGMAFSESFLYSWLLSLGMSDEDSKKVKSKDILSLLDKHTITDSNTFISLAVEFVNNKTPWLTLELIDRNTSIYKTLDDINLFKIYLIEGVACMAMDSDESPVDYLRAEKSFKMAHQIFNDESAPIVNLVELYIHQKSFQEAFLWLDPGLSAHPHNVRLWGLYIEYVFGLGIKEKKDVMDMAHKMWRSKNSWVGCSYVFDAEISFEMEKDPPPDNQKIQELQQAKLKEFDLFFGAGESDQEFLLEYTGIMGSLGEFSKIPAIIWQKKSSGEKISWRLNTHLLQSHLALNQISEAKAIYQHLKSDPDISEQNQKYLALIMKG
ncbi:MAG: tetratricopeptide repeat protein [Proteobacteria bacterium]|nr:tetratricopeptide repeat protein [Pseudomonadota bacterium]